MRKPSRPLMLALVTGLATIILVVPWAIYITHRFGGMPTSGWVAMILGIVLSVAVGVGLMALLFHSSRGGYDDRADRR